MTLPDLTVEVAFDTDPLDPIPVWTDITDWVEASQQVTIRRGRSSPTEQVQPGRLSLTLDNTDGRFTAGLASSPYYPNVTINRRIRVSAVHDAVTYRLFDGHVDKWPVGWQGGVRALTQITATDRTKLLARRPIRTLLEEEVLADAPVAFWPLNEPSGSDTAGDIAGVSGSELVPTDSKYGPGTLEFGADWRMNHSTAVRFEYADDPADLHNTVLAGDPTVFPLAGPLSVEWWFIVETPTPGTIGSHKVSLILGARADAPRFHAYLGADGALAEGRLVVSTYDAVTAAGGAVSTAARVDDGQWHHVVYTVETGGATHNLYLDGELVDTDGPSYGPAVTIEAFNNLWLGGPLLGPIAYQPFLPLAGRMARVALYDSELSAARVEAHYNAGRPSWRELSSDRVERLAGYADIPTGTIQTGRSYVAADQDTAGKGVNVAVQEVATSEDGLVFFAGDGTLTFHSRSHRMNQTSSFTLDAELQQVSADLEFEVSDANLLNDIAVDRPRGGPVRTVDQTSIDTFGTYAEQVSTVLATDQETQAFGQWQVSRRSTPAPRAGRVSVDPFTEPTLYPIALGTELGTKGTLDNLPATAPASAVDVIVEGIEHTFSVDGWSTSWDASPGDDTAYMVWGSDTWDNARWAW